VSGETFVCTVHVVDGTVIDTPPPLDWMLFRRNRSLTWLTRYCDRRHWQLDHLPLED